MYLFFASIIYYLFAKIINTLFAKSLLSKTNSIGLLLSLHVNLGCSALLSQLALTLSQVLPCAWLFCSIHSCLFVQCCPGIFLVQCWGNLCNAGAAVAATGYY